MIAVFVGISLGLAASTVCNTSNIEQKHEPLAGNVVLKSKAVNDTVITTTNEENQPSDAIVGDHADIPSDVQPPTFPGGMPALSKFLGDHIQYPAEARKKKIKGRVIVSFIVDKDGALSEARVLRSAHYLLDREAMRVVHMMPPWNPATKNGKPVKTKYVLPVNFKL